VSRKREWGRMRLLRNTARRAAMIKEKVQINQMHLLVPSTACSAAATRKEKKMAASAGGVVAASSSRPSFLRLALALPIPNSGSSSIRLAVPRRRVLRASSRRVGVEAVLPSPRLVIALPRPRLTPPSLLPQRLHRRGRPPALSPPPHLRPRRRRPRPGRRLGPHRCRLCPDHRRRLVAPPRLLPFAVGLRVVIRPRRRLGSRG